MVTHTLFHHLLGIESQNQVESPHIELAPDSDRYLFLEKGHIMEFLLVGKEKKIVSLFFEPNDFVIRSHPKYSTLVSLDRCKTRGFNYGTIIRTLRKFPQTKVHYQEIRKKYEAKVTSRINSLTTMTATERYAQLKETQP